MAKFAQQITLLREKLTNVAGKRRKFSDDQLRVCPTIEPIAIHPIALFTDATIMSTACFTRQRLTACFICAFVLLALPSFAFTSPPRVHGQTIPARTLVISEFMADPAAVSDNDGEWIELFNASSEPLDLNGWTLDKTDGSRSFTVNQPLVVPPGGYAVLARRSDIAANGGVAAGYDYPNAFALRNGNDGLLLRDPNGIERDRVGWGAASLRVQAGQSWALVDPLNPASWTLSQTVWNGSGGDFGSPGSSSVAAGGAPAASTPAPLETPADAPTPLPLAPIPAGPATLVFSEFLANPAAVDDSAGEWLELFNAGDTTVNLRGWSLTDLDSDRHVIGADVLVEPGTYVVLARSGDAATNGGVAAAYSYSGLSLANGDDELLLLAPDGTEIDRVVWGNELSISAGASLERSDPRVTASWSTAAVAWPNSAGDFGSPGTAPVASTPTAPTSIATTPVLPTPVLPTPAVPTLSAATPALPAPTGGPSTTATAAPLGTSTPAPGTAPTAEPSTAVTLQLSEFLADPAAVSDSSGEWLELFNAGDVAINLRGWVLADLGSDRHVIAADVLVEPGAYIVLARNGDFTTNGGVSAAYVYSGLSLANGADELLLFAPGGAEIDRVAWGSVLATTPGASLERHTVGWATAQSPWPGGAGDLGSPGAVATSQPPDPNATPNGSATPGPTATLPPGGLWPIAATPSPLQIEEVSFAGSDDEYIALQNVSGAALTLAGWLVGDAQVPGGGEGLYELPPAALSPGALFVIARDGSAFAAQWGRAPDAEFEESTSAAPLLPRRRDLATGKLALNNSGDEVLLLDPAGTLADAVAFSGGDYAALGLTGELRPPRDFSLQRVPGHTFPSERDVRHRFLQAPPDPFAARSLPTPNNADHFMLDDGFHAVWGTLGARSNFADETAPPHYLLAAAASQGLNFVALADPVRHAPARSDVIAVAALRQEMADGTLIAYGTGEITQRLGDWETVPPNAAAVSADNLTVPDRMKQLFDVWYGAGSPLLPAGNANPSLPGLLEAAPRYTGLAAPTLDEAGVLEALSTRRGWVTSTPGLWLTLRAEPVAGGETAWMGSTIAPQNRVRFLVYARDLAGDANALAIWQDGQPLYTQAVPRDDGRWAIEVAAVPGSLFVAVATQADGDFAVTAPIRVEAGHGGTARIARVLPAPREDHNGDGTVDSDDEFIDLFNPGDLPLALVGWSLTDEAGDENLNRRYTFAPGSALGSGETQRLWRKETGISLNDKKDYVRLLDPDGNEVDHVGWDTWVEPGVALETGVSPPPGPPASSGGSSGGTSAGSNFSSPDIPSTEGQAGGPPGSLAQAKLAGLTRWVEFDAVVTAPPGLYNASFYVADPAPDIASGPFAGIGIQVYLRNGEPPLLVEGERVRLRGELRSFRGEMELFVEQPDQIWPLGRGDLLDPLPVTLEEINESVEGRLVTFRGVVGGFSRDSIFLVDPANPDVEVQVTVRSSLGWRRPYVNDGEVWEVMGIVSQFARSAPWNEGYRVLVRYEGDLVEVRE